MSRNTLLSRLWTKFPKNIKTRLYGSHGHAPEGPDYGAMGSSALYEPTQMKKPYPINLRTGFVYNKRLGQKHQLPRREKIFIIKFAFVIFTIFICMYKPRCGTYQFAEKEALRRIKERKIKVTDLY